MSEHSFESNTDCFGIRKNIDVEVFYDFDDDGEIIIDHLILKTKKYYEGCGKYSPHTAWLELDSSWLSTSTLDDLACEIEADLIERKSTKMIEKWEERELDSFDSRTSGPAHYTGSSV